MAAEKNGQRSLKAFPMPKKKTRQEGKKLPNYAKEGLSQGE